MFRPCSPGLAYLLPQFTMQGESPAPSDYDSSNVTRTKQAQNPLGF